METTLEVLTTGRRRREGNRQWPDEVKARMRAAVEKSATVAAE